MTAARAFDLLWRTVACAAALTVIQMTIGALVLAVFGPGPPMPPNTLGWLVVSNLSTAAVLSWAALRSSWRGTPLAAALAAILFVVSGLTGLVEAIFFDVLSPRQAAVELVRTLLTTAAFGTVLVMILGRRRGGGRTTAPLPTRPARWWLTRLAVSDLAYVVFYFAA